MANKILMKSSQDTGDGATELFNSGSDAQKLSVAELALNTVDGILFAGTDASAAAGTLIAATTDVYAQPLVVHTAAQAVGTASTVQFSTIDVGHATDTTLARASAGVLNLQGNAVATAAHKLDHFATTSSAELAGVLSDETGTGTFVLAVSPALTGSPTAPTQSAGDNSTKLATTAYVATAADAATLGLSPKTDCVAATGSFTDATCITTDGGSSTTVTCDAQTNIEVGMGITGAGIPVNTYVTAVAGNTLTFTISQGATAAATITATFTHDLTTNWTYHAANATLTWGTVNTYLKIDGRTLVAGDRILVKNQGDMTGGNGDPEQDGIYTVSTVSAASAQLLLTRVTDMNTSLAFPMAFTFVTSGTMGADTSWVAKCDTDFAINSTALGPEFVQFNGPGTITAGSDLTKSGNTISVSDNFIRNDGSDTTSGTISCAGITATGTVSAEQLTTTDDCSIAGLATVGETLGVTGVATFTAQSVHNGGMSTGTVGLILNDASITDSSGAISFGDDNLSTSGTLGAGVATLATSSTIGNLTLADGSITDSGGALDFGDETLTTSGLITGSGFQTGNSGTVKFMDGNGDAYTSIAAHATATNAAYTLPPAHPGTGGYVLASTTAGVMSWDENTGGVASDAAATITLTDTATSAVSTVMTLKHSSTGINAVGGGVGMDFVQDTGGDGADNFEIGMQLESVLSENTSTEEDFDFSVKLMAAGLAAVEKFKVSSIGDVTFAGQLDGGTF